MKLEGFRISEIRQTENKYCMTSFICEMLKKPHKPGLVRTEYNGVYPGLRAGEPGKCALKVITYNL